MSYSALLLAIKRVQKFNVIGISVRITNENGQAAKNIRALWDKFMSEGSENLGFWFRQDKIWI
jgi:predicted transcriptional regulator YdeE